MAGALAGVYNPSCPARLNFSQSPLSAGEASLCRRDASADTNTRKAHTGARKVSRNPGPLSALPPPTVHIHTAALHNRVTEEIKRTVLLQGCAWLSFLTHILSGNNGVFLCSAEWPHAGVTVVSVGKAKWAHSYEIDLDACIDGVGTHRKGISFGTCFLVVVEVYGLLIGRVHLVSAIRRISCWWTSSRGSF